MIKLFNSVDALYSILESFRLDKQVLDYRIIVGANNLVTVFIISEVIESLQTTVEEYGATCIFITDDDTKEEYSFYFHTIFRDLLVCKNKCLPVGHLNAHI